LKEALLCRVEDAPSARRKMKTKLFPVGAQSLDIGAHQMDKSFLVLFHRAEGSSLTRQRTSSFLTLNDQPRGNPNGHITAHQQP
jgi:hypothetical protein